MQTATECVRGNPGPKPVFTDRMELRMRPDQRHDIEVFASLLGLTVSEVTRWILDVGIGAINNAMKENNLR
ncbi:MAG: hypothetical protein QM733_15720 [Ilumatobacteraceae bacterium]